MSFSPTILAGDEFASPDDFPSNRIDTGGAGSQYNSVGGLEILSEGNSFFGSAVALSPNWLLTAGHNVDLQSDGGVTVGVSWELHLPDYGSYSVAWAVAQTEFSGFGNPSVNDDLALMFMEDSLPEALNYWDVGIGDTGDIISLAGFGRSGFGSYGYTSDATLVDRRLGYNIIDSLELDDEGSGLAEVFLYDFDAPDSLDGLGNDRESIIAPGDSGGGAYIMNSDGSLSLVGINTFTEGVGGRFGDTGGGILVNSYLPWINEVTGLYSVPEPSSMFLLLSGIVSVISLRKRRGRRVGV